MAKPTTTVVVNLTGSDKTGAAWASANRRVANHRRKVKGLLGTYRLVKTQIVQMNSALGLMPVAGFAGVGAGLALLGKSVVETSLGYDRFVNSITAVTGSVKAGKAEYKNLVKVANQLGIGLDQAAASYKNFFAASVNKGVSISDTRLMFKGIAKQISVMGLTAEQTGRVMQGFSQIMSKGTLSAEELKQQVGESLSTAMGDAATSMKMDMDDFLKAMGDGLINGVEFMKIYANYVNGKYSPAVAKALIKTQGQINLMSNAWSEAKRNMADAGFVDTVTTAVTKITTALSDPVVIENMKSMAAAIGDFFAEVITNGEKTARILKGIAISMIPFGPVFKIAVRAVTALTEALVTLTETKIGNKWWDGLNLAAQKKRIDETTASIAKLKAIIDGGLTKGIKTRRGFRGGVNEEQLARAKTQWQGLTDNLKEYKAQLASITGKVADVVAPITPVVEVDAKIKEGIAITPKKDAVGVKGGEKIKSFREKVQGLSDDFSNLEDRGMEFIGSFADGLSTQLTEALMTGKLAFGDFARSILAMIVQMIIKMLIFKAISGLVNAFAGPSLSGTGSSPLIEGASMPASSGFNMGSFLGKAGGGRVKGGRPIMVGEAGREVFVPGEDGRIVPNHSVKTAQGQDQGMPENVNITLNLSTGVQSTVRAEIMGMMPIITKQVKNSVAEARQRGGSFSSRMGVA